jgi:hypothetical protein
MSTKALTHPIRKNRPKLTRQKTAAVSEPEAMFEKLNERLTQVLEQNLLAVQEQIKDNLSQMNQRLSANQELLAQLLRVQANATSLSLVLPPSATGDSLPQIRAGFVSGGQAGTAEGWQELLSQGEARRVAWIKDGLLVPTSELAEQWGRTRQALDQACDRGDLFSLKVGKNKYYPRIFLELDADAVKRVCLALKGGDSTAKFIFWSRRHGALGGKTIADAIQENKVARAEELALGWSEEHGLLDAPAA